MANRQRVLYIEKPAFIGGSVTGLYELVRGLDPNRYEPIVLFGGPNPFRKHFQALGVQVETLSEAVPPLAPSTRDLAATLARYNRQVGAGYRRAKDLYLLLRRDYPLAKQIARRIEALDVDLVHHNNCLRTNRATVLAAQLARKRQIVHVRSLEPIGPVERYLAPAVDAFVYMSRAVESLYRDLGIAPAKGHVLYDGFVPPTVTADPCRLRREFGLTDEDQVIANVGRFDWWKGHEYFIDAMAQVVRTHPRAKALLVGGVDSWPQNQAYYASIQEQVKQLGLEANVIFTGFRTDIPDIMATADLVVHSSSEPEPFGRVIVEAMLTGRPVVATAAGGVLDIVADGETGLLVPPKDSTAMAEAIRHLLRHPEVAQAMGRQGQQTAATRFSVEQHVDNVQRLYRKVLSDKS